MKGSLRPSLRHELALPVTPDLTVPQVSPRLRAFADMPPVFATAFMVGLVEAAAIECLAPHLDAGEHSVGTAVSVTHTAATPVGMRVRAAVELVEAKGRALLFRVEVRDEAGPVGEGTHARAVIELARFLSRVETRAEGPRA